jgi:hypothetical protein
MLNKTFTATITKDFEKSGWTCVVWPGAAAFFGTGKAVKVAGRRASLPNPPSKLSWRASKRRRSELRSRLPAFDTAREKYPIFGKLFLCERSPLP